MIACSGNGDGDTGPSDAGVDAGTFDIGPPPDMGGRRDLGPLPDTGPRPDMGPPSYCTENGEVTVGIDQVPIEEAMPPHTTSDGNEGRFSCIDNPPDDDPMFTQAFCFVECVNFLGYTPTQQEIDALEFAVFPLVPGAGIDPSYDFNNGLERSPGEILDIGAMITSPPNNPCPSGYQIEFGFDEFGTERFESEVRRYVIRIRNALNQPQEWVTTYHYNFIRRNDHQVFTAGCGVVEARIATLGFDFPIIHRSKVEEALAAKNVNVPGGDDLFDGEGNGYVLSEVRDCSGSTGSPTSGASVGTFPAALGGVYADDMYGFGGAQSLTSPTGMHLAVGLGDTSSTSSAAVDVAVAMGITRDGIGCTEEFGGQLLQVYSDSVTFIRGGREIVLHGRQP